jgi:hypothetical protein
MKDSPDNTRAATCKKGLQAKIEGTREVKHVVFLKDRQIVFVLKNSYY